MATINVYAIIDAGHDGCLATEQVFSSRAEAEIVAAFIRHEKGCLPAAIGVVRLPIASPPACVSCGVPVFPEINGFTFGPDERAECYDCGASHPLAPTQPGGAESD